MPVSKEEFKEAIKQGGNPDGQYDGITAEEKQEVLDELAGNYPHKRKVSEPPADDAVVSQKKGSKRLT